MSDAYSPNVLVLLPMTGSDSGTSFPDVSQFPKTFTPYGNAQTKTAQYKWAGSSGYFDGSGDYLLCTDSRARLDSGDHTVEFWFYPTDTPASNTFIWGQYYSGASGRAYMSFNASRNAIIQLGSSAVTSSSAYSLNAWHHFAWVRYGSTNTGYVDGTSIGTFESSTTVEDCKVWIGCQNAGSDGSPSPTAYFTGYIQDVRITKGIARYTADFTPPAAALPTPDAILLKRPSSILRRDLQDGGLYHIAGIIDRLGSAGSYRVRLFDRYSGRLVQETWSEADGSFRFDYLAYRSTGYFVVAFDSSGTPLNAAVDDFITPTI